MEIGHQEALWSGCMAHSYKSIFKDRINRTEGGFMLGNVRKKFIGDKQFYKMVLAIAIPIMIQNGITNFVSLLDNIMVGQIGTEQMSGVAIVNQLIFVYNLCIFGGVSGAGIFTAQYFGQKDDEGIRHTFRFKLWVSAILTALVIVIFIIGGESLIQIYLNGSSDGGDLAAALRYGRQYMLVMLCGLPAFMMVQTYASTLRECGETMVPMKAGVTAVLVNLVFNYLLIYGKFVPSQPVCRYGDWSGQDLLSLQTFTDVVGVDRFFQIVIRGFQTGIIGHPVLRFV